MQKQMALFSCHFLDLPNDFKSSHFLKTCEDFLDDFLLVIRMNVMSFLWMLHCLKSVRIRSYSGPHFLAFGLNTGRYDLNNCEYGHFLRSVKLYYHLGEKLVQRPHHNLARILLAWNSPGKWDRYVFNKQLSAFIYIFQVFSIYNLDGHVQSCSLHQPCMTIK